MPPNVGIFDLVMLAAVSAQATTLAYLHRPRWKALVYVLPIPFTTATLALGKPVGPMHAVGLFFAVLFPFATWWLHVRRRWPIVLSIAVAAVAYCAIGAVANGLVPVYEFTFWLALAATFGLAAVMHCRLPHRHEPGHRSPLPVPVKFAVMIGVVSALVVLKHSLGGFMATFPMLGVVAMYEARHSLWTLCRHVPVLMLTLAPMLAVCHVAHPYLGLGGSLAAGWVVLLAGNLILLPRMWRKAACIELEQMG